MPRKQRNRILRLDGKPIHLVAKRAHLMVCAKGCCCGRTDRGFPPVPIDFYKSEYKRRKLRNRIQLTMSGCLGPCPLANVALLFFDGRPVWFQSINGEGPIRAIFDYIDQMLAADGYLPPPLELADHVFTYYAWTESGDSGTGVRGQESRDALVDPCPLSPVPFFGRHPVPDARRHRSAGAAARPRRAARWLPAGAGA